MCPSSRLIQQLYDKPGWAIPVETELPPPPQGLWRYIESWRERGRGCAASQLCHHDKITPPPAIARFMSGERERALRARDGSVDLFIAELFNQIAVVPAAAERLSSLMLQQRSPVSVKLTGWDLYHGHLFAYTDNENL